MAMYGERNTFEDAKTTVTEFLDDFYDDCTTATTRSGTRRKSAACNCADMNSTGRRPHYEHKDNH